MSSNLSKAENNRFPGNPGIMSDGRTFTDYRPSVDVNYQLDHNALGHHHNDYLYRQYLIANSKNLADQNYQWTQDRLKNRNIHSQGFTQTIDSDHTASLLDFIARPKNLQ